MHLNLAIVLTLATGCLAAPTAESFSIARPGYSLNRAEEISAELEKRATPVNYNQDYVASGAGVTYTPNLSTGTFSVSYNTQADFVVGLGWTTGNTSPITYSGSFTASGVGLLSVYGWSTNPLIEYYIIEDPIGYANAGTKKGTVTSDGSVYDVWLHQQVNQPSIQGTTTFNQYISVRRTPRTSGTVSVANHFNAWAGLGMKLGSLNYQVVAVESWQGSGQGTIKVSK
ncbi:glycoside hydrolase family 11 protein [Myriangium duriaei CBS 260.36]|uniref:Endo-1,4-beta-xylanase n=1 Tax=Myriangium duriaei CBS 260.36 TaxID=1168546 RepID=A0A9P4IWS3_9PEZI|nr:glycoside hydrolase family 11 protein [Myriangium duriaei CBS 260.36]